MGKRYIYVKKRYVILSGMIDFIGGIVFAAINFLKGARKNLLIKRIAVIEMAHIGDALAITPALRLLRKKFPDASITIVISPWGKAVLAGNPDADDMVIYRASWFDRINRIPFSLSGTVSFIRRMRGKNFDLGIDMRGDFRTILLMWLCGIKKRVGHGFAGGGFLLTDIKPFDVEKRQDRHQVDHNLDLVRSIKEGRECGSAGNREYKIFFADTDVVYIDNFLKQNKIEEGAFLIAVHPGSGLPAKCWPIERFASLIGRISERHNVKVIAVGGAQEIEMAGILSSLAKTKYIDAVGKTSIKQLSALLKKCGLFIGGDSGVMHIAAAVKTPIVAIWGGHNRPSHWGPLSDADIVIHKRLDCGPCGLKYCSSLKCLKQISVEDVLCAVDKRLKTLKS